MLFPNRRLPVKTMIELEKKLQKYDIDAIKEVDNPRYVRYITSAYFMPFAEIKEEIRKYNESVPKMDELIFIRDLCERFGQEREAVLRRIREVKRISREMQS